MTGFVIRRLEAADAAAYREIRLEGLERHPEAFGSTYETEAALSLEDFARRVAEVPTFAAERDGRLLGLAGLALEKTVKRRHRGTLVRMYVRPEAHGTGAADALVEAVLDHARAEGLDAVLLAVITEAEPARRLYERHGFKAYGVEPGALRIGDRAYDDELRIRFL
ncbi:GNAT family N-acetyltransferase [Inquilinus sp. NPDC058860]|uniref:GNAT family N-acetyltransferase n=1 Tax=Inquilinus sp. NPDC058860 TaxID=3346652 RepID=UPI003678CBF0